MPKIAYVEKRFSKSSTEIIKRADAIIVDYQSQGLNLTLRQLYYRFVATGIIPNTEKSYKRLGSIINDARLSGMLDWLAIEDRGRNAIIPTHWDSPADIIRAAAKGYSIDKWKGQLAYVEVWVEKQALEAVVSDACLPLDVGCFACKGYVSQSEMWRAAKRFKQEVAKEAIVKDLVLIHLGDHDPSGIDMTRDIRDRMIMFDVRRIDVRRIALNMNQIEEYSPPPNPAKMSDSRAEGYVAQYGDESWELDALEPKTLRELIQTEIKSVIDEDLFAERREIQEEDRTRLQKLADNWENVE